MKSTSEGRKIGHVSKDPVAPQSAPAKSSRSELPSEQELLRILGDAGVPEISSGIGGVPKRVARLVDRAVGAAVEKTARLR
jgi:hypothetical protein